MNPNDTHFTLQGKFGIIEINGNGVSDIQRKVNNVVNNLERFNLAGSEPMMYWQTENGPVLIHVLKEPVHGDSHSQNNSRTLSQNVSCEDVINGYERRGWYGC